jgi:nucleotide-binding universal stress UspA family protein
VKARKRRGTGGGVNERPDCHTRAATGKACRREVAAAGALWGDAANAALTQPSVLAQPEKRGRVVRLDGKTNPAGGLARRRGGPTNGWMVSFARLLVPVDFSSASRAAFTYAMGIADRWGSQVVLFNAAGVDGNDEFLGHTGVAWGRGDVIGQARDHLLRFADTVVAGSASRVEIDAEKDDNPVRAVARACARHAPSLVVVGTRADDSRRWRRSRAEKIARTVPCPVLLVRGEPEARMDPDD